MRAPTLRLPTSRARSPSPAAGGGGAAAPSAPSHHGSIFLSLAKAVVGAPAPAASAPPDGGDGAAPREVLASRDEAHAALAHSQSAAAAAAAAGSPVMLSPAAVRLAVSVGGTGVAADEAAAAAPPTVPLDAAVFYGALPASAVDLPDAPDLARWELLAAARAGAPVDVGGDARVRFEVAGPGADAVRAAPAVLAAERALCVLSARMPSLSYGDVRSCFLSDGDAQAAFRLLDQDVDGAVTRDEFTSALCVLFNAWAATQSAVASFGGVSGAVEILLNGFIWM